ncbi:phage tail fiber protein [Pseudocitrobacter corydidari]
MIYNTGTISINGNTATGTGTNWTAPASQVRVSQTIIVLSNPVQMFQITAINSGTSLTVTPAASPALSGQKYGILVTDSLSVDGLAQSMSQFINEYDENIGAWETFASTSANQLVTVTINGTSLSIPAIGGLARKGANSDITELKGLTTALSIAQGGTGAKTAADARSNLGLGSSAVKDIGTNSGNVMEVGSFGLGITLDGSSFAVPLGSNETTGFGYWSSAAGGGVMPGTWQVGFNIKGGGAVGAQMILAAYSVSPRAIIRCRASSTAWSSNAELYHSMNTTKASDGTLKAASPVIRIVKSQGENQRTDIDEEGFSWAGNGTANAEAEGVLITRQDVGVYAISGAVRLASSGWQLLAPMDPGGMGELGVVEAEQDSGGVITIKLYRLKYSINASGEIERGKGELIDVPVNSWIDVRLDMPTDSIWNQKQAEAINAMEEADAKGLDFTLPH